MHDLIIHRLPFGGIAFEPVSDAGVDWLWSFTGDDFQPGRDACMDELPAMARGYEPQNANHIFLKAISDGLTMEAA